MYRSSRKLLLPSQKPLTRRSIVGGALALSGIAAAPAIIRRAYAQPANWTHDPFSLGVASGTTTPSSVVLWTRIAPEPLSQDPETPGGLAEASLNVAYEVATDPQMRNIVRRGTAVAPRELAYAVHVTISGLEANRPYWYRFMSAGAASRVGRTRTAPAEGAALDKLRFGFVSCAHYEVGYFSAYRHLADEDPEFVMFLGDYIYEYSYPEETQGLVRRHGVPGEITTLAQYRNRYALHRLDPDLQRLHAEVPALMTWDDHEVQNDYANMYSQDFEDEATFRARRTAAYRAFYEHMPLTAPSWPNGPSLRLYRRYGYGNLADVALIDGRQYRSRPACYGPPDKGRAHTETNAACPERLDESRSMLGLRQEAWLQDGIKNSNARWNIVGEDVMMAQLLQRTETGEPTFWTDDWNGYPANRKRLLETIHEAGLTNVVMVGGDIHSCWANDLKLDFDDPNSPTVATEFMGTSITSSGPPHEVFVTFLPDNPHVKFFDARVHGYSMIDVTPERMTTQFRVISDRTDPEATISTLKTFAVENDRAGVIEI